MQTLLMAVFLAAIILAAQDPYWQYFAMNLVLLSVLVMSMDLVIGWGGIFALHSTTLFIVGEYVAPVAQIHFGIDFVVALIIAAAMSTAFSMVFALFALRVRGILLSLVTIFVAVILPSAILAAERWTGGGWSYRADCS
jgi:branched-chain amino acid transport system permease protein